MNQSLNDSMNSMNSMNSYYILDGLIRTKTW
jgi:hypothetical protein